MVNSLQVSHPKCRYRKYIRYFKHLDSSSDVSRPCGHRLPEDEAYLKVAVSAVHLRTTVKHYGC